MTTTICFDFDALAFSACALAYKAERVVIDDLEARRCAKVMGLLGIYGCLGRRWTR